MSDRLLGTRIVVIGAGIAGLAAAKFLKSLGAQVVVLEARQRPGGRVFTDRSLGAPVDLGAAAIHGAINNPLTALAAAACAETRPLQYDSIRYYLAGGVPIGSTEAEEAAARFEQLRQTVVARAKAGETVAQAIKRIAPGALDIPMLALYAGVEFEFDIGGSLGEIGAAAIDDHKPFEGGDLILPYGFDQLVHHLCAGMDVHLGFPIEHVAVSKLGVHVRGASGAVDADYCICTIPIGVLKSRSVIFAPALAPKIAQAIDRLGAGHVTKIAFQFDRCFWDDDRFYIGYASGRSGRFPWIFNLNAAHPSANILLTFALGDHDHALKDQSDEAISNDALGALRDIYGSAVQAPREVRVTRWNSDPYSLCSYSFAAATTRRADFDAFCEPIQDRLFFAGEHTIADCRGTAHGAFLSGKRAAMRIAALVGR